MSEVFKTPMPMRTPKSDYTSQYFTPQNPPSQTETDDAGNSDKESTESVASTQCLNGDISLVAKYDDIVRMNRRFRRAGLETNSHYLAFIEQVQGAFREYCKMLEECKRLQTAVDTKSFEISDLEYKLLKARKMVDHERNVARNIRRERDDLAKQIGLVQNLLLHDRNSAECFPEDVKNKLSSFLHHHHQQQQQQPHGGEWEANRDNYLKAMREINSTGSMLSDFSYSRSEDDLDVSVVGGNMQEWKRHRPSTEGLPEPANKKRRSSANKAIEINATDTVRATTTLTVTRDGPIKATSVIESIPQGTKQQAESQVVETNNLGPPPNLVLESWAKGTPRKSTRSTIRSHTFQQKILVIPDTCNCCDQRIRFGKTAFKCKECKSICHAECKDLLQLPCIPQTGTPSNKHASGAIRDYTPTSCPMVPALLMHCINEIELRGLNEVGLYRVSGSEREVRTLKERLLKSKHLPSLEQIDVHVLCGVVKEFLRGLREPLITFDLWKHFVDAAKTENSEDSVPALCQIISELPQPNRDTLSYMILHLQKVAQSKQCKMNTHNLARVFGPTIVGYSSEDIRPDNLMQEVIQNNNVMEHLINISSDYWSKFIDVSSIASTPSRLQQTPSTDSLLRPTVNRGFFATNRTLSSMKKPQRYFPSPKR